MDSGSRRKIKGGCRAPLPIPSAECHGHGTDGRGKRGAAELMAEPMAVRGSAPCAEGRGPANGIHPIGHPPRRGGVRGKPDSVRPIIRTAAFIYLAPRRTLLPGEVRRTRGHWASNPTSYSALHRIGFVLPPRSPGDAVGPYPTISPLPTPRWAVYFL